MQSKFCIPPLLFKIINCNIWSSSPSNCPRRTANVMSSSLLVCKYVCLFVCLYVSHKTHGRTFMRFSGYVGQDTKNNLENFSGGMCVWEWMFNLLHTGFLFIYFFKEIRVCEQHYGKMDEQTSMFSGKVGHETCIIWNIIGMLRLTPWIWDLFFYFLDPCLLVVLLMEKRLNGFSWIFMICQARHKKLLSRRTTTLF